MMFVCLLDKTVIVCINLFVVVIRQGSGFFLKTFFSEDKNI